MLNMGNGEHTGARIAEHYMKMGKLFTELSGIQQMGIGPTPDSKENIEAADSEYKYDAKKFIRELANDLGVELPKM